MKCYYFFTSSEEKVLLRAEGARKNFGIFDKKDKDFG